MKVKLLIQIQLLLLVMINVSFGFSIRNNQPITNSNEVLPFADPVKKYDILQSDLLTTTNMKINNMLILQNEILKPIRSPGETSLLPISINAKGRLEIAASVISTAIFILSLSIKFQEMFQEKNYSIQNLSNDLPDKIYSDDIELLDSGIKFITQNENVKLVIINPGDEVKIMIKFFFNGLEIKSYDEVYEINDDMMFDTGFINFDKINIKVPFPCLKDVISTIPIGSNTKMSIPPSLAYGSKGFPPFVPADATILCEISLFKF